MDSLEESYFDFPGEKHIESPSAGGIYYILRTLLFEWSLLYIQSCPPHTTIV
jgi:hypothetical protein